MTRPYSTAECEPRWTDWRRLRRSPVPRPVLPWLFDQGSLTARLRRACGGQFRVRVVRQGWGRPLRSEAEALTMRPGLIAIVREVELRCDGVPWVFARTLIPATSLSGPARRLAHLGERPLGELLFTSPHTERGLLQMARLTPRHRIFHSAVASLPRRPRVVWGRRTLFRMGGRPLLVNEIFLPAIPESPR